MADRPPRLHIIGGGCPHPIASRFGSAFVLETNGQLIMVDCGPATMHKLVKAGLDYVAIRTLLITHHHFDHTVDFPCFALTQWDQSKGTEPPLKVFGPPPTSRFVEQVMGMNGAFIDDLKARVEHSVSIALHKGRGGVLPRPYPKIEATDVGPGKVTSGDGWSVTCDRVHHSEPWLESLAYRVEHDGQVTVFAADCGDCESLRQLSKNADTLVIGCVLKGHATQYESMITGTADVADIANAAGVKRVVLSHAAPGISQPGVKDALVADCARLFKGEVVFPEECSFVPLK